MKIVTVILAGGFGTRLWPISRENYPKQFHNLIGDHSLLQETVLRARASVVNAEETIVLTNDAHYFICHDQLQEVGVDKATFLLEPCARNTAPAIALAAEYIVKQHGADTLMIVLPSDHLIKDLDEFYVAADQAIKLAETDKLVTFGIVPNAPKTGYGYIEAGDPLDNRSYIAKRFVEKPDQQTAESFLKIGRFYWNSGMFVFKAATYLQELKSFAPEIYECTLASYAAAFSQGDFVRFDHNLFAKSPNISIDYAVMEKSNQVVMVSLNSSWSDLGCWSSIAEMGNFDHNSNVIQGDVIVHKSNNCFIRSDKQLVTAVGIEDQIIVATGDAILIANKKYSQEVKNIVENLKQNDHHLAKEHQKVLRPWGYYESLVISPGYQVKHLMVKPGGKLSLQMHYHRSEHWVIVSGQAEVVRGEETLHLYANQSTYIPKETQHRLSNPGPGPLHVIEVQLGDYLGEDDIVRFEDIYHRNTNEIPGSSNKKSN